MEKQTYIVALLAFSLGVLTYHGWLSFGANTAVEPSPLTQATSEVAKAKHPVTALTWIQTTPETMADYPKTEVAIKVSRQEGEVMVQKIAIVDGSCNELLDEVQGAFGLPELLCYYAGFGYRFRVKDIQDGYVIERKEIEEASPDYNPPIAEYKAVLTIPK